MKTEKILERVCAIDAYIRKNDTGSALFTCAELASILQDELNTEVAKKKGRREAQKAAMRILKNSTRDQLTMAQPASDGSQLISDSFRIVKVLSPLPIPQFETADKATVDLLEHIIKTVKSDCTEIISLKPTVAYLKSLIARAKAENDERTPKIVLYKLSPMITVDAMLLIDLLYIFPDAVITLPRNSSVSPIYLESSLGCGVLFQLRSVRKEA